MKKKFYSSLLAFMAVLLLVATAVAGTTTVNHGAANTTYSISVETLGVSRDVMLAGNQAAAQNLSAANVAVSYRLTQDMTTQNLLQVSLSNAAFNGTPIFMCAPAVANATNIVRVGTGTPTANATTFNFQASANVASGSYIFLTSNACPVAETLVTADARNFPLRVPANVSTGMATIELRTVTAGNIPVDPSSTANAINIAQEFVTTLTTRNMVIDYLNVVGDGSGDGTKFADGASSNLTITRGAAAGAANIFTIFRTVTDFAANAQALLTPGFTTITDAATDWTGAVNAYLADAANCSAANIMGAANTSPAGAVTLTHAYPGAAGNTFYDICINVNGTTEMVPRTITGTHQVTFTGNGANPTAAATGSFQIWATNGFQAYVPHMRWKADNTSRTYVRFVNRSRAADAQVSVQRNGSAPVVYNLGTIPANGIVTYDAMAIANAMGITDDNFAALFTIKTGRNNIHADAYFNNLGMGTRMETLYENPQNKDFQLK